MRIQIENITKTFGEKKVLSDVCFHAESGSALGLLGRNGAGKTTTIRIIMRVFPPDSGQVLIDGVPIGKSGIKIGYLPEERGLYPKKLIGDQMVYFGELRGMSRKDAISEVKRWLDRFEMGDVYSKKLDTLSKGNQQKIQLAVALIHNPDLVILDEPFSGLDPVNAQLLKDVVRELSLQNKLVLFSSHQMGYVEEFCDSIALLNNGNIVLEGDLGRIKRAYPRDVLLVEPENEALNLKTVFEQPEWRPVVSKVEQKRGGVSLKLTDPVYKEQILGWLVSEKIGLRRFEVTEPSLEQIFIEKAGETVG